MEENDCDSIVKKKKKKNNREMEIEWRDVKLQGEWMNEKKIERNKKKMRNKGNKNSFILIPLILNISIDVENWSLRRMLKLIRLNWP